MDLILPYKVGDLAESKSLVSGYRGAWFRCKIHNMRVRLGYLECYLEYIDYPGEKKEWVRLFRKNSARSNQNSSDSIHTMIRPSFPKWYFVHEVPEQFPNSDVTAIVDETWQIGDRVDWLKEGCYWSGTITKIINEDLVEIELPAPPIGEGKCYKAKCSDLRPTLEWSLARGWMVPLSQNQMMIMTTTIAGMPGKRCAELQTRLRKLQAPWSLHLRQPQTTLPATCIRRMLLSHPQRTC
ncbi:Agenet domain-containing protein [Zea mays]|uniref:Agenet domain-containing protein n=1 Tax=Zea mays TaxID=4577 RepID=B4FG45_MAIZE|nr:unknown [Zea mays]AQK42021.1 Agenet domain-containing protein [Zea mays]